MTSLLDRRKFLTGSLIATTFAAYAQVDAVVSDMIPASEKQIHLYNELHQQNPEIDVDIKNFIANKYGDYQVSPLKSLAAGATAGAAYSYLEIRSEDEPETRNKNTLTDKLMIAMGLTYGVDMMVMPRMANLPVNEIFNDLEQFSDRMSEPQRAQLTMATAGFLYLREYGTPAMLPAVMTALGKEHLENYLDRMDVNIDNDGPR